MEQTRAQALSFAFFILTFSSYLAQESLNLINEIESLIIRMKMKFQSRETT